MKKILSAVLVMFFAGNVYVANAQDQPAASSNPNSATDKQGQVKFFYYPSTNTYYNEATSEYLYYDEPTSTWLTVKQLPTTIVVEPTATKYPIMYKGNEVWKENADHKSKYKVKKDGMKEKSKTDDGKEKTKIKE